MTLKHSRLMVGVVLALVVLLSSCTVVFEPVPVTVRGRVRFGIEVNDVIQVFEPTRGSGAIYRLNERIAFRIRTDRDGYITLTAIDPTGDVYVLVRNFFVRGNQTTIISGPDARSEFVLVPPRGLHRVRAAFTPTRTSGSVTYRGVSGEGRWTQTIVAEVRGAEVRDIAETRFFLE
jgi:hypothetical protein